MNASKLTTLAAGLFTCICLSGLSASANAQYFSNDNSGPLPGQRAYPQPNELFRPMTGQPVQRQDQLRSRYDRYLRTNVDGTMQDERRNGERCPNGQCQHRSQNGTRPSDGLAYRGQQRYSNDSSARRLQSRSTLTTGWDPTYSAVDPATGRPVDRSLRHNLSTGDGAHGHCRGGACREGGCREGVCDCPEGQCDCPVDQRRNLDSQFRQRDIGRQNSPASYDRFDLSRRNTPSSRYAPTRSLLN